MKHGITKDKSEIKRMIANRNVSTFKFYARPSFLEGMARLVDITGELNKHGYFHLGDEADFLATYSDWENVGLDMLSAIEKFDEKLRGESVDAKS
jgi:hypothetical protein